MDSDAPPSVGFYNFLGWLETNKKRAAIGAGVVLFAGIIVGLWVWHNSERATEAEEKLSSVRMPFSPLEAPAPGTGDALAKIASDYPKTPAAAKALLRAGSVYFGEGNYAKARAQFDTYLREFGETPWIPEAVFGLAACLDAENKTTEAITKYNDFVKNYASDPSADQARLNLARLQEKNGQPALALEVLTKMANPQQPGYNPAAAEAQEKVRELYAKYPELMTPPPAPTRPPGQPPLMVPPTNSLLASNRPQIFLRPDQIPGATPSPGPAPTQTPIVPPKPVVPTSGK